MTSELLELVPRYGAWVIAAITFLSCLAVPVPASLFMMTAGGFVASGDLAAAPTLGAAIGGAVMGDQLGFSIGRRGGGRLIGRLRQNPRRAKLVDHAVQLLHKRGWLGVFLSRWLFSPLGPWINFAGGAAKMGWRDFTQAGILGEVLWVALYIGLGWAFAGHIVELADLLGNASGFLAALAVTIGLGFWLRAALQHSNGHKSKH